MAPRDQIVSCYLPDIVQVATGRREWLLEIKVLVVIQLIERRLTQAEASGS